MKRLYWITSFLHFFLAFQTLASAPDIIEREMEMRVERKNCQSEWVNQKDLIKKIDLSYNNHKLYAYPCSNWGYNTNWSLFFVVETKEGEVSFMKPLYFVRYVFYKGLHSDEVVSNIKWNQEELELTSFRSLNGTNLCGEIAGYIWDVKAQDFKVKGIVKKDNCQDNSPWTELSIGWSGV